MSLRGGRSPTWQSPGTIHRSAQQETDIVPGDSHGPIGPRNDRKCRGGAVLRPQTNGISGLPAAMRFCTQNRREGHCPSPTIGLRTHRITVSLRGAKRRGNPPQIIVSFIYCCAAAKKARMAASPARTLPCWKLGLPPPRPSKAESISLFFCRRSPSRVARQ